MSKTPKMKTTSKMNMYLVHLRPCCQTPLRLESPNSTSDGRSRSWLCFCMEWRRKEEPTPGFNRKVCPYMFEIWWLSCRCHEIFWWVSGGCLDGGRSGQDSSSRDSSSQDRLSQDTSDKQRQVESNQDWSVRTGQVNLEHVKSSRDRSHQVEQFLFFLPQKIFFQEKFSRQIRLKILIIKFCYLVTKMHLRLEFDSGVGPTLFLFCLRWFLQDIIYEKYFNHWKIYTAYK